MGKDLGRLFIGVAIGAGIFAAVDVFDDPGSITVNCGNTEPAICMQEATRELEDAGLLPRFNRNLLSEANVPEGMTGSEYIQQERNEHTARNARDIHWVLNR